MFRAVTLALAAVCAAAAQDFDIVYTNDGEPVVQTRINGANVWLLIDTGSTSTILDKAYCAEQHLRTATKAGTSYGIYGKREGIEVLAEPPQIEGIGAGCAEYMVVDLGMRNGGAQLRVVGIVGTDYLKNHGAVLDLKNHRISIEP